MEPQSVGYLSILALLVVMVAGMPIGVALGLIGFAGLWLVTGSIDAAIGLIQVSAYSRVIDYSLSALPLFILMSYLALASGMSTDIFNAAAKWMGKVPAGMAVATVIGNVIFGAICGSSMVSTTVFTKIAYPEMIRFKYDLQFTCGTIVGGAMLGMLIPPSILMVLYGVITEQSIAELLLAGIGPGLLLATLFAIYCYLIGRFRPALAPKPSVTYSRKEKMASAASLTPVAVVVCVLIGGLYTGLFTPTEAGGAGALAVLGIGLAMRRLSLSRILWAISESTYVNATLFLILIGALIFGKFVAVSNIPKIMTGWVIASGMPTLIMISGFLVIYLIMGCFLDSASMMLLTLPILHPLIVNLGLNPIWFAMLVVMAIEIGLLTPPFGLNVYAMKAAVGGEIDLPIIFRGAVPFALISVIALVIMMFVPAISTFIPSTMFKAR